MVGAVGCAAVTAGLFVCRDAGRVCFAAVVPPILEVGLGSTDSLTGEDGLMGEVGNVRELCDFGDNTALGPAFLDTVLDGLEATALMPVVVLTRFFGFSKLPAGCSFSLSYCGMASLGIIRTYANHR